MPYLSCTTFLLALLCVLGLMFLMPGEAHAGYLDAGAGSTFVQGIIAAAASVSRFWRGCVTAMCKLVRGGRA